MDIQDYERVLRELSPLKAVLLFLFCPTAFKRRAVEHDTAYNIVKDPHIMKLLFEGKYKPDIEHMVELVELRTSELRKTFLWSALIVMCVGSLFAVVGFALYCRYGQCPSWLSVVFQMLGVGLILWATLWELGWWLRSMGGETLPERVRLWLFRAMYATGSAFFFLAYSWSAKW
jgi:hypothetical protein